MIPQLILLLLSLSSVGGSPLIITWGPNTHVVMTKKALAKADPNSIIVQRINQYPDAFYCGLLFPDIAVLYYYTKFEDYQATHSWLFYKRLLAEASNDEERVFAYGVACHLIQDCVAHNYYIPKKIRETKGSNYYTHPLVEAAVEKHYFDPTTSGALESVDKFLPLANKVLGRDVSQIAYLFRDIVRAGAFYEDAYAPPEIPFWNLYEKGANYAANLYGVDDHYEYIEKAIELTVKFLNQGETPPLDPTGIRELMSATSFSNTFRFFLTFFLAIIGGVMVILIKKRREVF